MKGRGNASMPTTAATVVLVDHVIIVSSLSVTTTNYEH
jgi:hypothetical protein